MRTIAFLGLGIMGSRMALRLVKAGFVVRVWNRTPNRCEGLRASGAQVVASPGAAAAGADVAITMLGDPASVRDVALGSGGLIESLPPGSTYVDRETGEEMEPVAMILPLAPSASSLPRTPANLRDCRRCDQLIGLDVSDCPYCGLRQSAL